MVKKIALLGSTGSIGRQTLDVVRALPGKFSIVGLSAGKNMDLLAQQINEFHPALVSYDSHQPMPDNARYDFLSLEALASHPAVDTVVIGIPGKAGLGPTLAAVRAGKTICLANKESLVMAGEIVTREARQSGAHILPVDSEHSALWQCLRGESKKVARLILTASGGPFRHFTPAQLKKITVEQALRHPSWHMGKKITIDSATMMNKGLEVTEAHWLFDVPFERIEILIHAECIVHSMVEFIDGAMKAQLGQPDMRLPIQYALSYPERLANPTLPRLDWTQIRDLTFEPPDFETFPCLRLAIDAGKKGGTYPAVLCAADEVAVELFLARRIKFTDIARYVEQALAQHKAINKPTLDDIMAADAWARDITLKLAGGVE